MRESSTGVLTLGAFGARVRLAEAATPESVAVRRVLGRSAYAAEDSTVMALPQRGSALVVAGETVPGVDSAGDYEVGSTVPAPVHRTLLRG